MNELKKTIIQLFAETALSQKDNLRTTVKKLNQATNIMAHEVFEIIAPNENIEESYRKFKNLIIEKSTAKIVDMAFAENSDCTHAAKIPDEVIKKGTSIEEMEKETIAPNLKQQFINLLDQSIHTENNSTSFTHPAFEQILSQITPDEALLISLFVKKESYPAIDINKTPKFGRKKHQILVENFTTLGHIAGVNHPEAMPLYIDNLCRLGVLKIEKEDPEKSEDYRWLESHEDHSEIRKAVLIKRRFKIKFNRKTLMLTHLGRILCTACLD